MLLNIFTFPVVNYQRYYYNFYIDQIFPTFSLPEININEIKDQNPSIIQESNTTENLKLTLTKLDL